MAAIFKIPVSTGVVVRAEHLFPRRAASRAAPPRLTCRWTRDADGKLVCVWSEAPDGQAPSAETIAFPAVA